MFGGWEIGPVVRSWDGLKVGMYVSMGVEDTHEECSRASGCGDGHRTSYSDTEIRFARSLYALKMVYLIFD